MGLIKFLLVGLVAGSMAKMITPQEEKGGWLSSLIVGIIGAFVGGFLGGLIGLKSYMLIGEIIMGFIGAVLVLFIYHKYFSHKNLL